MTYQLLCLGHHPNRIWKQIDKLRRKEEKRKRRGTEHGVESDVLATIFSSLLHASERENPFDNLIGSGPGPHSLMVTALP